MNARGTGYRDRVLGTVFPVTLILLFAAGCASSGPVSKRDNFAYLYGKGGDQMPLEARVHHITPDRSRVYYKLRTRDLLYKSDGTGGPFHASVRVSYESYNAFGAKLMLDSASTMIDDASADPTEDKELIGSMDLRRKDQRSFILKIMAHDLNRDLVSTVFLRVDKGALGIRQYFMPIDSAHGLPLFSDHFTARPIRVRCEVCAGQELQGSFYSASTALPVPVFTTSGSSSPPRTAPDSTFRIKADADGDLILTLQKPGVYHLKPDSSESAGYSLFAVEEAYPLVTTSEDMLRPMRYITSNQEFDRISRAPNVRQAIERFWIDAAGDRERGREAIRIYFSRVENANRHFTSEVEGWRTDRGLVHIIFGTPTSIYKTDANETWIYGEENNLMSLTFTFTKRQGPFTDNEMVLQRDPMLKGAWYRNVESWRNGRVYQN